MEQNDVFEEHETAAVHVKICPHDQRYTQFHTEPLMIVKDGLRGKCYVFSRFTNHVIKIERFLAATEVECQVKLISFEDRCGQNIL